MFSDLENPNPDSSSGSVTISMEEFYAAAKDADYLVYNAIIEKMPKTVEDLAAVQPLLGEFSAVESDRVYCVDNNLYQATDKTAGIIEDFYRMLYEEAKDGEYIQKVPRE